MATIKTIEEKAKAYDEAIERAESLLSGNQLGNAWIYKLLPELKESEGERTWIINYLSNRILNSPIIAEKENLKKAIAWVEKQGEQKSAEWSEEDENRINRLIAYFEDKESFTAEDDIVYANWLKSLRPQSHWKPSEEQMEAVRIAGEIGTANSSWAMGKLKELYQELKKLREE